MANRKLDERIKEVMENGKIKYKAQVYLGIDPLTGKVKRTTLRSSKSAEDLDLKIRRKEAEIKRNGIQPKLQEKKFQEVYELWYANYKRTVKESTWASTELIFRVHILPIFGENYMSKMDVMYCQKQVNDWADSSPKNFKKYKNYTSNVFDYAVTLKLIQANPMRLITIPRGEQLDIQKKRIEFYTKDELLEFLETAKTTNKMIYTFFFLLGYTGLRKGEALALEWSDIDFGTMSIDVHKTVTRGENNRLIVNRPKTSAGNRIIMIDNDLAAALRDYKKSDSKIVQLNQENSSLVFSKDQELINPTITKTWLQSVYRESPDMKRISAHGFRHTHASLLFEAGSSLKDAQERLGHSDINITANVYTHVTENKNRKTVDSFSKFMNQN
ncbi:site-specific integrase [Enterococcus larvae]|uniref:site-specific integrase n=1 Tax=Enterococcus larvae TaxID=2794352 RepID=UPI003F2F4C89